MSAQPTSRPELRPYQSDFVNRMPAVLLTGTVHCLIAPTGSGKSVAVATVIADGISTRRFTRVLVLAPRPLVEQTVRILSDQGVEATQLHPEAYRLFLERGGHGEPLPEGAFAISVDFAKREDVADFLTLTHWDLVVVEEAQLLTATRAEVLRRLRQRNPAMLLISATHPHLDEDWLVVDSITDWRPAVAALWRAQLAQVGHSLRRQIVRYQRPSAETVVYKEVAAFADGLLPFRKQLVLRLAASSPSALEAALERWATSPETHPDEAGDLRYLLDLLDDVHTDAHLDACLEVIRGHKLGVGEHAVVFCDFIETARYVATAITELGLPCSLIYGSLSAKEQDQEWSAFQTRGGVLVTTSAGKWSNLNTVTLAVHHDAPRSVERFLERELRYWRVGRVAPCTTVFLVDDSGALPSSDFVDWLFEGGADFLDEMRFGSVPDEPAEFDGMVH